MSLLHHLQLLVTCCHVAHHCPRDHHGTPVDGSSKSDNAQLQRPWKSGPLACKEGKESAETLYFIMMYSDD